MNLRKEILSELAEDLILFGKVITPKTFYLPTPDFHYEIADVLMDRNKTQVAIQAPRGFGKSTLSVCFILHHIIFDEGDKVIIIQSKTRDEAINRLTKIKRILKYGKTWGELFGNVDEDSPQTSIWRENKIQTKVCGYNVTIRSIGTLQPARGTLESGIYEAEDGTLDIGDDTRITLYFLDDPDDEDNTKTIDRMKDNFDKFIGIKEGLDKRTGRVLVIGTLIRVGCILQRLMNMSGWYVKDFKNDLAKGIFLWSEYRDKEFLRNKKAELASAFKLSKYYSEYEGTITGDEDQIFREENIQWWDGYLETINEDSYIHITHLGREKLNNNWQMILLDEEIIMPVHTYIGIDPASSRKPGADFSVTMPIAYDERKNIYVLPYFEKRLKPTEHAKQIISKYQEIKPKKTYVETTAYQESLRNIIEDWSFENNEHISGISRKWQPRQEKDDRLQDLERFANPRKLHLQPGMQTLWDELTLYPRGRKNLLDGLWYATRNLSIPKHTKETHTYTDDELMFIEGHRERKRQGNWLIA